MTDPNLTIETEIWKAIPGFPGYEISDHGRIRSFKYKVAVNQGWRIKDRPHKILKMYPDKDGYNKVLLCIEGKHINRIVPRLVLETFIGPCPDGLQACHNDGCCNNDKLSNLRWDTPQNNQRDRGKHGTKSLGEKNGNSKIVPNDVVRIRNLYEKGFKQRDIAKFFHISQTNVWGIVNYLIWKHI